MPAPIEPVLAQLSFPPHVRAALDEGTLWRAKEILQGRVGTMPYSPELYEQYGAVLLAMQDRMQAGKYLFLSGVRRVEYEEAIAMFLERHGARKRQDLVASFPAHARSLSIDRFPGNVRAALIERGVRNRPGRALDAPERLKGNLIGGTMMVGCIIAAAIAVASMVVGLPIVFDRIADLFR
jgi:hypothetical protein